MADWQKGDLALCVVGGPLGDFPPAPSYPRTGQVIQVEVVGYSPTWQDPYGVTMLISSDLPENVDGRRWWAAHRFIKVTPQSEDAFDREVNDHMAGQEVGA